MTEEIIERLRSLDLSDGGSHSRLSAIASCFLEPAYGWTRGACEELRNMLIETLEDANGNDDNDNFDDCDCAHHRCDQHGRQVSYDELGNERHKAVCELRKMPDAYKGKKPTRRWYMELCDAIGVGYATTFANVRDRLIHLLGGDECNFSGVESYMDDMGEKSNPAETSDASTDHVSFDTRLKLKTYACIILEFADTLGIDYPNGSKITDVAAEIRKRLSVLMSECKVMGFAKSAEIAKPESEDGGKVTITDELRKFKGLINTGLTPEMAIALRVEINRIADRIDEQFDRICEQQETVLQSTIDTTIDADKIAHKCYIQRVEKLERQRDHWHQQATDMMNRADAMEHERDELQEKCDRLKTKVEHQREQLAVYATTYDFDAIRALKRERNEHKHRADNAEGHVKSLERRLDAAHETYCALLNDAAREFRALTEERDERYQLLPKDSEGEYVHIGDVMEDMFGDTCRVIAVADTWFIQSGESVCYKTARKFRHHRRQPVTVEQVIRDLTLGKITESQAVERIEDING